MRTFICLSLFVFVILFLLGMVLHVQVYGQEAQDTESGLEDYLIEHYHLENALQAEGDFEIKKHEIVRRSVFLRYGTLVVAGLVEGDVVVVHGDVEVTEFGIVQGDVVSVGGKVWHQKNAEISGDIIEMKPAIPGYAPEKQSSPENRKEKDADAGVGLPVLDDDGTDAFVHYNRVDGTNLGFKLPSTSWWIKNDHRFALLGKLGYTFKRKKIQYSIGLEKWFFRPYKPSLGIKAYSLTATQDDWIIGTEENSMAAFFIREDFRDYYLKNGFQAYLKQGFGASGLVKIAYQRNEIENLTKKTDWSLFGGDKKFRPNPAALHANFENEWNEARARISSLSADLLLDTRNHRDDPTRGWLISVFAERAGYSLHSDYEFQRCIVDLRRYQPMGWDENIVLRLRAGSTQGMVPPAYWFDIGGISTLRAYDYKSLTGNRMVLANLEYHLRTSESDWFIFHDFDIILFMDSGLAWFTDDRTYDERLREYVSPEVDTELYRQGLLQGFDHLQWSDLKTNVGIALAAADNHWRINFAKRTTAGNRDIVVTFRVQQTF